MEKVSVFIGNLSQYLQKSDGDKESKVGGKDGYVNYLLVTEGEDGRRQYDENGLLLTSSDNSDEEPEVFSENSVRRREKKSRE